MWLAHFCVDFMIGIWPVYKTIAHLDLAKTGLIAGLCAFIGEGLQILFGALSDKGYRRRLIMLGMFATTGCAFLAYAESYWVLGLMLLMTCLGSGAFHPAAVGLVGSLSAKHKGLLITLFASGGTLGLALSQLVYSQCYTSLSGHTVFLALPTLLLIGGILAYKLAIPSQGPVQYGGKIELKQFFALFRVKNIPTLYFSQVCSQTVIWGTIFLLPDILVTRGHADWVCFGGGHLCFILGGAMMMVPSGLLADRYSCKNVIFTATLIGFSLLYFMLMSPLLSGGMTMVVLFLMGSTMLIVNPVVITFGNRLVPTHPGMVSGCLMGMALCLAEGLGMGGGGLLTKLFDEDAPAKALSILGLFYIASLLLIACLPHSAEIDAEAETEEEREREKAFSW